MANTNNKRAWIATWFYVLAFVVICMDKSICGTLMKDIQGFYQIKDSLGGAAQSAPAVVSVLVSPIIGYFGDRYNRKILLIAGITVEMAGTLLCSVMPNYIGFLVCRGLVGMGQASVINVAPCIISDMFRPAARMKAFAVFYMAAPIGVGVGFVSAQGIAYLTGDWRNGFYGIAGLGSLVILGIILFTWEPPRGAADGQEYESASSSYLQDLKSFVTNPSLVTVLLSDAFLAYLMVGYSSWGPKYFQAALAMGQYESIFTVNNIPMMFGISIILSGVFGVPLGAFFSSMLQKVSQRSDPIICVIGITLSCIFMTIALYMSREDMMVTLIVTFLDNLFLSFHLSLSTDIILVYKGLIKQNLKKGRVFQCQISTIFQ